MIVRYLFFLVFGVIIVFGTSCHPKIIRSTVIYRNSMDRLGPCEPSIVVNPADVNNVVAATVLDRVYRSMDGGKTWDTERVKSSWGVYGDPCLIADAEGNVYFFHLANPGGKGQRGERFLESIVVQKSSDKGITWTDGVPIGINGLKDQDKEWAIAAQESGKLYVTWTEFDTYGSKDNDCHSRIRFSSSFDYGDTWSFPVTISANEGNCLDDDYTTEGAVPACGRDGFVCSAWSFDDKIWFNSSNDDGKTWKEKEWQIAEQPGGWNTDISWFFRANGMPVTTMDLSGGNQDNRIYVNWADARNGTDDIDIFIMWSDDFGKSWTKPRLVNETLGKGDQIFTWMCVDQKTGWIHIVYYSIDGIQETVKTILSSSGNGGKTFQHKIVTQSDFPLPDRRVFFGDYNNISAHNGVVRPVWTEWDGTSLSVHTSLEQIPK
jgi:hypothetical protein